jgi:hypothetical protein
MAEMPIDPEFGRFVGEAVEEEPGPVEFELPEEESDVEEQEDGSAVVTLSNDFKGPAESEDFYSNLSDTLDLGDIESLGTRYLGMIEDDREARSERDKQYEEGLRRTGMGNDAPGGASFSGASKVVHPIMAEACVDFAARACKEMFPPEGPTRKSRSVSAIT